MVTSVGWTPQNELFTVSDEKLVLKWGLDGEPQNKVCDIESFCTDCKWYPSVNNNTTEIFVVACSDGTFRLYNKNGRMEKSVEAHTGAVTSLAWNNEGTALATSGEDGFVKQR